MTKEFDPFSGKKARENKNARRAALALELAEKDAPEKDPKEDDLDEEGAPMASFIERQQEAQDVDGQKEEKVGAGKEKEPKETEKEGGAEDEKKKSQDQPQGEPKQEPQQEPQEEVEDSDKIEKELMAEVEKTRAAFVAKDYEISNVFSRLKNVFRGHLKTKPEENSERQDLFQKYTEALKKLSQHKISEIQKDEASQHSAEIGVVEVVKFFNQDEKINMYEAYTASRAENWEKRFGKGFGTAARFSGKYIDRYRKLDRKTKMALGIGASLTGVGFLVAGHKTAGAVAAGTGVTILMESRHRKKEAVQAEKERISVKEDFVSAESQEERYEKLMGFLDSQIEGYDKSLKREKKKAKNRKIIGVAVTGATIAAFLASGPISEIVDWGMDKTGAGEFFAKVKEYVTEKISGLGVGDGVSVEEEMVSEGTPDSAPPQDATEKISPTETSPEKAPEMVDDAIPPEAPVDPEVPKGEILTVEKGSSFQGEIIKYLEEKGMSPEEAGTKAHLMYSDFIEKTPDTITDSDYNIIPPGSQLEIGLDANGGDYEVVRFDTEPLEVENVSSSSEVSEASTETTSQEELVEKETEEKVTQTKVKEASVNVGDFPGNDSLFVAGAGVGMGAGALATKKAQEGNVINFPDVMEREQRIIEKKNKIAEAKRQKEFEKLSKKYKLEEGDEFFSRAKKFIRSISLGSVENWSVMKNVKPYKLEKNDSPVSPKLMKNIKELEKEMVAFLGVDAKFEEGETLKKWMARVSHESLQNAKPKSEMKEAA
jgi:hypothetical protein